MSALVTLSWRLARAGGRYRLAAQVGANALGALVVAFAVAVPRAVLPTGASGAAWATLVVLLAVVLLPLGILLVTVGRLSAATRDRRLAALRVLGLGPSRTRAVGAAEAGLLAGAGALVGAAAALAAAPLVDGIVRTSPGGDGRLLAPLRVTVPDALAVVVALVVLAALASTAGTWRLTGAPLAQRATSTARLPLPWATVPLGAGLGLTGWLALGMPGTATTLLDGSVERGIVRLADVEAATVPVALVASACVLLLAVGAAYVPALLASWTAGLLVRSRRTAAVLAGRGAQTEPTSVARVVASVGTVVLLATCAAGYLGVLAADPAYRLEKLAADGGPVAVLVTGEQTSPSAQDGGRERDVTLADVAALRALPDVLAATPVLSRTFEESGDGVGAPFVGTCAELARILVVEGCRDDVAASIVGRGLDSGVTGSVVLHALVDQRDVVDVRVPLADEPVRADAAATAALWGGVPAVSGQTLAAPFSIFVPTAMIEEDAPATWAATVYVVGGPEAWQRFDADASALGLVAGTVDLTVHDGVRLGLAALLGLVAWFVGVAVLGITLAALDRQRERRRTVARLVAVGVPPRTLRAAQAWQVLLPLGTAVVVAVASGLALVGALAWSYGVAPAAVDGGLPVLLGVVGLVVVLVPLLTLPAAGVRLTPELLRDE